MIFISNLRRKEKWKYGRWTMVHPDKFVLLDKLYDGTINREDAIILQNVLEEEKLDAETSGDALKLLLIVGMLVFLVLVISRLTNRS